MNILTKIETEFNQKPKDIMRSLGIGKSYYSMIKNEKVPISKNLAIQIYQVYGIPLEQTLVRPEVHKSLTKPTGTDN